MYMYMHVHVYLSLPSIQIETPCLSFVALCVCNLVQPAELHMYVYINCISVAQLYLSSSVGRVSAIKYMYMYIVYVNSISTVLGLDYKCEFCQ